MNTTETTQPQEWLSEKFESRYGPAVRFTSPLGFTIELVGTSNVVRLLTKLGLTTEKEIQTPDGTRFYKYVDTDKLVCVDTDQWQNPGFKNGDDIGSLDGLVSVAASYLLEQAWSK